jgi:anti-anti-sigma factor
MEGRSEKMSSSDLTAGSDAVYSPHQDVCIREIQVRDTAMTVFLEGHIRYHVVSGLQGFLHEQFTTHQPSSMVLDFNQVKFIDSQGLALLIAIYKFCAPSKCSLSICGASPNIRNLVEMTRINTFIKLI